MRLLVGFALILALAGGSARGALVLNEIHPDPTGSDAGREFIEILNTGPEDADLNGVGVEFANGSDPRWQRRWTASAGDRLAAGARLLLGDAGWSGPPAADAVVVLALQNGPDAVRLVRGDSVLDLVGYGTGLPADLAEGDPATLASGRSLARRPDGRDTGDNARDLVDAAPTPGAVNFAPWDLVVAELALEPPSLPAPGRALRLTVVLRNDGWGAWPPGRVAAVVGVATEAVAWRGCAPADTAHVVWSARPGSEGRMAVALRIGVPDGTTEHVLAAGACQVGPADLRLEEVLSAPTDDQGEWIELAAARALDLADYRLRDADGDWRILPDRTLAPGERVVLAQDDVSLRAWSGALPAGACRAAPDAIVALAGWPALNNGPPADRTWADRVLLADAGGVVVDHVTLPADLPAGRSLERAGARPTGVGGWLWAPSRALAGATPGCANSLTAPAPAGGVLELVPAVLDAARDAPVIHVRADLPAGTAGWQVAVHDLWGAPVRRWAGAAGPGVHDLPWGGDDDHGAPLPPGGYVVTLSVRDAAGDLIRRERALAVVR